MRTKIDAFSSYNMFFEVIKIVNKFRKFNVDTLEKKRLKNINST